jgi:hypothetical protein
MRSSWQMETGHLVCRWSEAGRRIEYKPHWMQETGDTQSGYLPPVPDFASHSPFGGPSGFWFLPRSANRDSE